MRVQFIAAMVVGAWLSVLTNGVSEFSVGMAVGVSTVFAFALIGRVLS